MDETTVRQRLEARIAELLDEIERGEAGARPVELDPSRVGRLSRMDALQAQALGREALRRRKLELSKAKAALARLEAGSYGECLECGEPIAERRLEHDPGAALCIDCARAR